MIALSGCNKKIAGLPTSESAENGQTSSQSGNVVAVQKEEECAKKEEKKDDEVKLPPPTPTPVPQTVTKYKKANGYEASVRHLQVGGWIEHWTEKGGVKMLAVYSLTPVIILNKCPLLVGTTNLLLILELIMIRTAKKYPKRIYSPYCPKMIIYIFVLG